MDIVGDGVKRIALERVSTYSLTAKTPPIVTVPGVCNMKDRLIFFYSSFHIIIV